MLLKLTRLLALALPLTFVACGSDTVEPVATTPVAKASLRCTGSYVGTIDKPSLEVRIAMYEESLRRRGIKPGDLDYPTIDEMLINVEREGIYMAGNFAFETDANCKVVKGGTNIFTYPYAIEGTVNADRGFDIVWTGSGSTGQFIGQINPDGTISGQLKHPAPDDFIYGLVNGTFTPNGKI